MLSYRVIMEILGRRSHLRINIRPPDRPSSFRPLLYGVYIPVSCKKYILKITC